MIKFQKESLSSLLPRLTKAIPTTGMGYLRIVWLVPSQSSLTLGINTLDSSLAIRIPAQCGPGDPIGVEDGVKLCRVMSKLPDGEITITMDKKLIMRQAARRYVFDMADSSWFAAFPGKDEAAVPVDGSALLEGIIFAQRSLAPDTRSDGVLACAYIEPQEDRAVNIVGFNGFQLAFTHCPGAGIDSLHKPLLISNRHLSMVKSALSDGMQTCHLDVNDNLVIISADMSQTLSIPLYSEVFPEYASLIRAEYPITAVVDRQQVIQGLERLSIVSGLDGSAVRMSIEQDVLKMTLKSSEGEGSEEFSAETSGRIVVGLEVSTLAGLIRSLPGEGMIRFAMSSPEYPCTISPVEACDQTKALIMPVILNTEDTEQYHES